ncbi:MAG: DUF1738 domain-containing protein [Acetobacteraceae bacterium]|nr:DUF1738 domain-containing protein [Acetobacteraceae bacterium]
MRQEGERRQPGQHLPAHPQPDFPRHHGRRRRAADARAQRHVTRIAGQRRDWEVVSGRQYPRPLGCGAGWGYLNAVWGTYRQWRELGAQMRQGEWSSPVVFWRISDAGPSRPLHHRLRLFHCWRLLTGRM